MAAQVPASRAPHAEPLDRPLKSMLARVFNGLSPAPIGMAYYDWLAHLAVSPTKHAELASSALRKTLAWRQYAISPSPASANTASRCCRRTAGGVARSGDRRAGVAPNHEQIADFTLRQWLDMLSPSNAPLLNPQVLRETFRTGGANLAQGFANWSRDALAVAAGGKPRGVEAFRRRPGARGCTRTTPASCLRAPCPRCDSPVA
jgi:polyhydroxyalkanoate synthase